MTTDPVEPTNYEHLFADTLYWIMAKLDSDDDENLDTSQRVDAVLARCEHWIKEYDL